MSRFDRLDPAESRDYCEGLSVEREAQPELPGMTADRALHALLVAIADLTPLVPQEHRAIVSKAGMAFFDLATLAVHVKEESCPF